MEKEAIKPKYRSADKLTLDEIINSIPPQLTPTNRISWIIGAIFVVVIIIGALNFPLGALMNGDLDIKFAIGYPMDFFVLNLQNAEEIPFKFAGLAVDTLIYLLIAYAIDVTINVFLSSSMVKSLSDKKETKPEKYQIPQQTTSQPIKDKVPQPKPPEKENSSNPKL